MKINRLLIISILLVIITIGAASAADNATQNDAGKSCSGDDLYMSEQEPGNVTANVLAGDAERESIGIQEDSFIEDDELLASAEDYGGSSYDNKYYLFRGDCWSITNNIESSVAVTSETPDDLTVTGTFRTQQDFVGLYWYSQDPIQHPYISYGTRSDYRDVILEFDYEMDGCQDFSVGTITFEANTGEIYYVAMGQFIENGHFRLDFNALKQQPGNVYIDRDGVMQPRTEEFKVPVDDLKYMLFVLSSDKQDYTQSGYVIMNNTDFTCRISNITVANGEICNEQPALAPHQYRICEGYDDIFDLNPYRIANEMRKLGYVGWVDFYIGASHFYEKSGNEGDVITDTGFNHNRTEKMVLDKTVPLNKAFMAWLDCYSRQLKNNGIENLIISVSMENLQAPQSWRQMDAEGNFAMSGWEPSTFLYSPCNDEAVAYVQKVSEACLDIVVENGLRPILQMGETWWWWNENDSKNKQPYFYDNSTKARYLEEFGTDMPIYYSSMAEYDNSTINWLNQQLVKYSDTLRNVIKSDKYTNGTYMALFFTPSVMDPDRVPKMMREVNFIKDAYSPSKLDVFQIEDYDWVIYQNMNHNISYTIGQDLGFSEDRLHYFGGFVPNPEDADKFWPLIEEAMDEAAERNFSEVYVWSGLEVRRDGKFIGYDEDELRANMVETTVDAPDYAGIGEEFAISVNTQKWLNGTLNVYDIKTGNLLVSSPIADGHSSAVLSIDTAGLNRLYIDFDYSGGEYYLIHEVYVGNKTVLEAKYTAPGTGSAGILDVTLTDDKGNALKGKDISVRLDGSLQKLTTDDRGQAKLAVDLPAGTYVAEISFSGEGLYLPSSLNFNVDNRRETNISANSVKVIHGEVINLIIVLKDDTGSALAGKEISVNVNGSDYTVITGDNGQAIWGADLLPGNYSAELLFKGDERYLASSYTADVTVNRRPTELVSGDVNIVYGDDANLVATLKDDLGNALAGKEISFALGGVNQTKTTDDDGKATFKAELTAGNYSAVMLFAGDEQYLPSSDNVTVIVNRLATGLSANDVRVIYGDDVNLIITLKDTAGNVLSGKEIQVNMAGVNHTISTGDSGQVKLTVKLAAGNYSSEILFAGDDCYLPSSGNASVIVNRLATSLAVNDVRVIYSGNVNLIIALKDGRGNVLGGKDILVSLNGVNHTSTTDDGGQATLSADLLPGEYAAEVSFAGDESYLPSSANAKVTVNKRPTALSAANVETVYGKDADLVITLKDNEGNSLAGENITITLNGIDYNVPTDANGQAKVSQSLPAKEYTADIEFAGGDIYNPSALAVKVVVKKATPKITASSKAFKAKKKTKKVTATLKSNGKPMEKTVVKLTVNKKTYKAKTSSKGVATFKIKNLTKKGKYKAIYKYAGDSNHNAKVKKVKITVK